MRTVALPTWRRRLTGGGVILAVTCLLAKPVPAQTTTSPPPSAPSAQPSTGNVPVAKDKTSPSAPAGKPPAPQPVDPKVAAQIDLLVKWMTGRFSNAVQSESDPENFMNMRVFMVPIWPQRPDGPWIYAEHALFPMEDFPFNQRVYRLSPGPDGTILLHQYEFIEEHIKIETMGAWKESGALADLSPERDFYLRDGCSVYLRRTDYGFEGKTRGKACRPLRGDAVYATFERDYSETEMRAWDRGFDSADQQSIGPMIGDYIFAKVHIPGMEVVTDPQPAAIRPIDQGKPVTTPTPKGQPATPAPPEKAPAKPAPPAKPSAPAKPAKPPAGAANSAA